jgi:HSP20 family molecular chaperone IbpA
MFFFEPLQPSHDTKKHYPIYPKLHYNYSNKINHPDLSHIYYDENETFYLKCNVDGYELDELSVDFQDGELIISGCHKENQEPESMEKLFIRRIRLPEGLDPNKIRCELDGDILEVSVLRLET